MMHTENENEPETRPVEHPVEGKHYYIEDGLLVFTAAYHLARGDCCGNRCRHCPFGYINVKQ